MIYSNLIFLLVSLLQNVLCILHICETLLAKHKNSILLPHCTCSVSTTNGLRDCPPICNIVLDPKAVDRVVASISDARILQDPLSFLVEVIAFENYIEILMIHSSEF